jgi:DNA (cytosine-5)-methyltransferase 1
MRKLSLFSGIGGIDLAAHWAGMETVAFCEREPFPQKVLRKHWPNVPIYDDVCTLTAERLKEDVIIGPGRTIDIISAGYPCQPFSNAGKRQGKEDDRHLWPEVHRLLQEIRPRWFVGENVAGHVTLGLDDVLSDLGDIGYTAQPFIIPSSAVGAPHRRDRVFIVGYTASPGFQEWRQSGLPEKSKETGAGMDPKPERPGENVADTNGDCGRWKERAGSRNMDGEIRQDVKRKRNTQRDAIECGSENVANASCSRQQERHAATVTDRTGHSTRSANERRTQRTIESQLGGVLDGISGWLDGYQWPAGQGTEQYDWEPPRVATGVKDRVGRLKGLGNAVNPRQIYPVFAAIKAIDDLL